MPKAFKIYSVIILGWLLFLSNHLIANQVSRAELKERLAETIAKETYGEERLLYFLRLLRSNDFSEPHQTLKRVLPLIPSELVRQRIVTIYGDLMQNENILRYEEKQDFWRRENIWESYYTLRAKSHEEMTELEVRTFLGNLYDPFFTNLHNEKGVEIFRNLVKAGECKGAQSVIQHFIDYENSDLNVAQRHLRETERWRWGTALGASLGMGTLATLTTLPFQMESFIGSPTIGSTVLDLSLLGMRIAAGGIGGYSTYLNAFNKELLGQEKVVQERKARIVAFERLRDKMNGEESLIPVPIPSISVSSQTLQRPNCWVSLGRIGVNVGAGIKGIFNNIFH